MSLYFGFSKNDLVIKLVQAKMFLQPMFLKSFDNFPPEGGCSEGLDAFRFFVNRHDYESTN